MDTNLEHIVGNDPSAHVRLGGFLASVQAAADRISSFLFDPAINPHHRDRYSNRELVCISHNADADGFGSEIVQRSLEAAVRVLKQHELDASVTITYERLMAFSNDPQNTASAEHIVRSHGALRKRPTPALYIASDLGSSHLAEIEKHFRQAVVIDHHPLIGQAGPDVLVVNPLAHGFSGNELSGAGGTYLVFERIMDRLLGDDAPFKLTAEQHQALKKIKTNALLGALGGAAADRVGDTGINHLLYAAAEHSSLIERVEIGVYGVTSKKIEKIVGEASDPPYNILFPVLTRRHFLASLAQALHGKDNASFSPQELDAASELYARFGTLFMHSYKDEHSGPHSGIDTVVLRANRMNAALLNDGEIGEVNALFARLGVQHDVFYKETVKRKGERKGANESSGEDEKQEVVAVDETLIPFGDFNDFRDDLTSFTEGRVKLAHVTIPLTLKELAAEVTQLKNRPEKEDAWLPPMLRGLVQELRTKVSLDDGNVRAKKRREGSETKNIAEMTIRELSPDELTLLKVLWERNNAQYGDPTKREVFLRTLNTPNFIISYGKQVDMLYNDKSVAELGNLMTAISKTKLRDQFLKAANLMALRPGESAPQAYAHVNLAHQIYRRIIAASMSNLEYDVHSTLEEMKKPGAKKEEEKPERKQQWMERIGDGVYFLKLDHLKRIVEYSIDDVLERNPSSLTSYDLRGIDLRTMVGIFGGLLANTGKFPERYVVVFAATKDPDLARAGVDGVKVSGRISTHASDIYPIDLGNEFLTYFGGGGHKEAAAFKIPNVRFHEVMALGASWERKDSKHREILRRIKRLEDVAQVVESPSVTSRDARGTDYDALR